MSINKTEKRFLAFCINFPQDLPAEFKQMFNQLLNSELTYIVKLGAMGHLNTWTETINTEIFTFIEKEDSYHIFNSLNYVLENFQQGKNQSIAYGVPHFGFDLVFIEVVRNQNEITIIDSYMLQNSFITELTTFNEKTRLSLKGYYARNAAVSELAKTLIEQNIQVVPQETQSVQEAS